MMYLYTTSGASKALFPENDAAGFRHKLPRRLTLPKEPLGWEVAVLDLATPDFAERNSSESVTLFCDICELSIHGHYLMSALLTVNRPGNNSKKGIRENVPNPRYVRVVDDVIERINVYLLDERGERPSFDKGELRCTLHFRPIER
jgi:hypothetical protein